MPKIPEIDFSKFGSVEIKPLGRIQKISGARLQASWLNVPHVWQMDEADITDLEEARNQLKGKAAKEGIKLTPLPFLMRALVRLIPEFPQVNARYDDSAGILRRYRAVHMGIAAQTPNGLLVPVVRNAEVLDLWESARAVQRLAEATRTGKASVEELSGSTITLTSLGPLGGVAATPVINYPEVAIIGPNRIIERPVVLDGQITVRKMMNLSSSFDHRIVDGHDAASFIQKMKALLEHPATLFI